MCVWDCACVWFAGVCGPGSVLLCCMAEMGTANADSLPWGEGSSELSPVGVVSCCVLCISSQEVWSWKALAITFYQGWNYVL